MIAKPGASPRIFERRGRIFGRVANLPQNTLKMGKHRILATSSSNLGGGGVDNPGFQKCGGQDPRPPVGNAPEQNHHLVSWWGWDIWRNAYGVDITPSSTIKVRLGRWRIKKIVLPLHDFIRRGGCPNCRPLNPPLLYPHFVLSYFIVPSKLFWVYFGQDSEDWAFWLFTFLG